MARQPSRIVGGLLMALLALASCSSEPEQPVAPPRASDPIVFPNEPSLIGVDLEVDLAGLERDLEAGLPRQLWSITQEDVTCVPSKKVDLALFKIKTPKLKCDIDGEVTRGRLRVTGSGDALAIRMPVKAVVVARDIGGILKRETGTAELDLVLGLRLDLTRDWHLRGNVDVDYTWSEEPGIDFLGRRIKLTKDADKELGKLRQKAEAAIEQALKRAELRPAAERGWKAAHVVLELNRENPAVWARIAPQRFKYGGYRISGKRLQIFFGLEGMLETHVGTKPEPPVPGPLPPIEWEAVEPGSAVLKVPVVADYAVLEPVIMKALAKRARRPFELGEYGSIKARFDKVVVYGTTGNRIAVGITFAAESDITVLPRASGTVWLTARPVNEPNSRAVDFTDVEIAGNTDIAGEAILLALANSEDLRATIADALKQNFENDFEKLRAKIDRAIAFRKDGPVAYSVTLEGLDTGRIEAYGQGLYMPVEMRARMNAELVKMD